MADAIGISRESAQLHLKMIRLEGLISFKGYGRGAADMSELDGARLVLAAAASTFAKDSAEALRRFANLAPVGTKKSRITLEGFLADRIKELPMDVEPERRFEGGFRSFGSRRLARTALQLYEPLGEGTEKLPRYAVVRWLEGRGHSKRKIFGPVDMAFHKGRSKSAEAIRSEDSDDTDTGAAELHDVLAQYATHQLFQIRVIRREALIEIAAAIKGVESYGNAYGNAR
ncbi:hypothetical protein [Bradyrhizobium sp. WSM471]|uniref:hypothetical protein n=1 Tax=Bradyrhizobium sp. WSM471 TaxID=319017 RepID=UPI0012F7CC5A|nr:MULTISPECIES: hypothetical protein [Bradyrhizobium]UFW42300.1 hypothetical protein BcanWSM471_03570 [Bradyrhizobium canariense]